MNENRKITFDDLSPTLKVFVVIGWIVFSFYAIAIISELISTGIQ